MFYFDEINGQKVLKSDLIQEINAFFTTRGVNLDMVTKAADIISPNQVHGNNVEIVDSRLEYPETDGLILSGKNKAVCLRFADCTPLIFYDTENKIAAVSHAGWRGTATKIAVITLNKMAKSFGTKVENVKALIGPAISICCYEVGDDVKDKLLSTVSDSAGLSSGNFVSLKDINARQLQEIGVNQIDIAPYCTCCDNNLFYSYRKENGTKERHYAIVTI